MLPMSRTASHTFSGRVAMWISLRIEAIGALYALKQTASTLLPSGSITNAP
jgi:hypothetical protein